MVRRETRKRRPSGAATTPIVRVASPTVRAVILDADGLLKLARGDRVVGAMLREEVLAGCRVLVPWNAVIQALAAGGPGEAVDRALAACGMASEDLPRAHLAAGLLRDTGTTDVPDASVASEALLSAPAIVITSDPGDLRRLLESDPRGRRVVVWGV